MFLEKLEQEKQEAIVLAQESVVTMLSSENAVSQIQEVESEEDLALALVLAQEKVEQYQEISQEALKKIKEKMFYEKAGKAVKEEVDALKEKYKTVNIEGDTYSMEDVSDEQVRDVLKAMKRVEVLFLKELNEGLTKLYEKNKAELPETKIGKLKKFKMKLEKQIKELKKASKTSNEYYLNVKGGKLNAIIGGVSLLGGFGLALVGVATGNLGAVAAAYALVITALTSTIIGSKKMLMHLVNLGGIPALNEANKMLKTAYSVKLKFLEMSLKDVDAEIAAKEKAEAEA